MPDTDRKPVRRDIDLALATDARLQARTGRPVQQAVDATGVDAAAVARDTAGNMQSRLATVARSIFGEDLVPPFIAPPVPS